MMGDEIAAIRERWAKATPGPWAARQWEMTPNEAGRAQFPDGLNPEYRPWCVTTAYDHPQLHGPELITGIGTHAFEEPTHTPYVRREDAQAIAAAPQDVATLLREVDRLREVEAAYDKLHADIEAGVVYLLPAASVERLQGRRRR